jgi:hypothetical protein
MAKTLKKPAYGLHKPTNQARVRISGTDHYLGEYGSPDSKRRYDDLILEWLTNNNQAIKKVLVVDDLCVMFLRHARKYYCRKDGTPTGETESLQHAIKFLIKSQGRVCVRDFGPLKFKAVRQAMITAGMVRTNINRQMERVRRVFGWGVENELVPVAVFQALKRTKGTGPLSLTQVSGPVPFVPSPIKIYEKLKSNRTIGCHVLQRSSRKCPFQCVKLNHEGAVQFLAFAQIELNSGIPL